MIAFLHFESIAYEPHPHPKNQGICISSDPFIPIAVIFDDAPSVQIPTSIS